MSSQPIKTQLDELLKASLSDIAAQASSDGLYQQKVKYLGKTGAFSGLMKELAGLPKEERPAFGQLINLAKNKFEEAYAEKEMQLKQTESMLKLKTKS